MQNFRYDINGLRAYAVATVVLFHFGVFGFSGGFVGVDIFFVISGFLMTSIVERGISKDNFSIFKFYLSRAIRILPALFVLCVILIILGWFFLLPADYKALNKHIFSSINFISNVTYFTESGYFDTSSHNKALLHTWSLSLEWQFYIIFPIILLLLYKINNSKKFIISCFIIASISSLLLSIFLTSKNPSAGFFLLPTRSWELLVGGLIYFYSQKNYLTGIKQKCIEITGFLFILLSVFLFSSNTLWPSYNAVFPVLGSALILLANNQNSTFTKHSIFQFLGNISYSIYLWHWPIVFFLYYYQLLDNNLLIIGGIFLSIILGYISYKLIENPSRKYFSKKSIKFNYFFWIISISTLSFISLFIYFDKGLKNRFSPEINKILSVTQDINPRREECLVFPGEQLKSCEYGKGKVSLLVVGDSHANAMMNGIEHALPKNTSLLSWTVSGCTTAEGLKKNNNTSYKCGALVTEILSEIQKYPKLPILIVNRTNALFKGEPDNEDVSKPTRYITKQYSSYSQEYNEEMQNAYIDTLCKFAQNNSVYVTRPTPEANHSIPESYAKKILFNTKNKDESISFKDYMKRSDQTFIAQDIASKKCGIKIIDVSQLFCDNHTCRFINGNQSLLVDDDHLSWNASLKLSPFFKRIFN